MRFILPIWCISGACFIAGTITFNFPNHDLAGYGLLGAGIVAALAAKFYSRAL